MKKYIVQYSNEKFYRDRDRVPRHFKHNATKLSLKRATQVANETNGKVIEI